MKKLLLSVFLIGCIGSANAGMLDEINYRYGDSTNKPGIQVGRARGQSTSPEHLYTSDIINGIYGFGYDGTVFNTTSRSSIEIQASENWTSTANGTQILFKTTPATTTTAGTALTIGGGNVSVSVPFVLLNSTAPRTTSSFANMTILAGAMVFNSTDNEICVATGTTQSTFIEVATGTITACRH